MMKFQVKDMKVTTRWDAAGDPIPDQNNVWFRDVWNFHPVDILVSDFPPKWIMLDTVRVQQGSTVKNARMRLIDCNWTLSGL